METLTTKVPRVTLRRRRGSTQSGSDHETSKDVPTTDYILDNQLPVDQLKKELLALTHRLKIVRWRHIPVSEYSQIKITRISGALTNAVYCVTPPAKYLFQNPEHGLDPLSKPALPRPNSMSSLRVQHVPQLLLRVYGPNTSQIIDRATELAVLKRLSTRNIGPRILGFFTNGRFEQFLKAHTLTKEDIRSPDISNVIAKRMRELHEGIDLTLDERSQGPGVWKNFDKWATDAKAVLDKLDMKIAQIHGMEFTGVLGPPWSTTRVLGTDWEKFMEAVKTYRHWLDKETGGPETVAKGLVFAHNDAQYGNLLRVEPPSGSPLLRPANEHKTLVVIDFEYASPNVRGYDIANHFCEWMSDYHDPDRPQDIHCEKFPTETDRVRFIESYVMHGLDSYEDIDKVDRDIAALSRETTIWRAAVHLGWCMWGIISAPTEREPEEDSDGFADLADPAGDMNPEAQCLEGHQFDYLDYASQKAALFWGDIEKLGIPIPDGVETKYAMYVGEKWKFAQY
ncbi:kinase-like domain-containing protein [Lipomyces tetrasporus]|uniref:Kinase-like domain-containing protein n=1 Tax=Lipomyces tetrasporus TaxID=54092 RepID=A0AAD7VTJ2_9ASCO|nr:kinase-like domain-containing protein [Lipomyces tetrasporus]KAJ8102157.1 kinase-like domain-containing protein [Lipomyces tetrasporus]